MIYYVYVLMDPRELGPYRYGQWTFSHLPFYVGKGKGDRYRDHGRQGERSYNTHKERVLSKLNRLGLKPVVILKRKGLEERRALDIERTLIEKIGRHNLKTGPLVNLTSGGEGTAGRKVSSKERKIRSEAMLNRSKLKKLLTKNRTRKTLERKSESEKEEATRKRLESLAARTESEKKRSASRRKKALKKSAPERMKSRAQTLANRSESEKDLTKKRKQAAWAIRTPEQKKELERKRKTAWTSKTSEQKSVINASRSIKVSKQKLNRTEEEKEVWRNKLRATWAKKTKAKQKKEK